MIYRQDYTSYKNLFIEDLTSKVVVGAMATLWGLFIFSATNYSDTSWYWWLISSRIAMACLGALTLIALGLNVFKGKQLSAIYMTLSVAVQASHGFLEGPTNIDFQSYTGILFILFSFSYLGTFKSWVVKYFPLHILFMFGPILHKEIHFYNSFANLLDNFSLIFCGFFIGIAIAKLTCDRFQYFKQYKEVKEENIKIKKQLVHDMQAPIAALEVVSTMIDNDLLPDILKRLTSLNKRLLNLSEEGCKNRFNAEKVVKDLINLHEKVYSTISFEIETKELWLDGDELSFERMVSNIIRNAVDEGVTKVKIAITGYRLYFKDNGPGYPEEVIESGGKERLSTKSSGRGYGLTQVFDAAKSFNAEINLSNSEGAVTEIEFKPTSH